MVLRFQQTLSQACQDIELKREKYFLLPLQSRTLQNSDTLLEKYAEAKWNVITSLQAYYGPITNLENWINGNRQDEIATFLNEWGSNVLLYSERKIPARYSLWLGKRGCVIGIEQQGNGFDAQWVHELRLKNNKGTCFDFFRSCKSLVFFDDPRQAKKVYFQVNFTTLPSPVFALLPH